LFFNSNKPFKFAIQVRLFEFVNMAFAELCIELEYHGSGDTERATVKYCATAESQCKIGREVLAVDARYNRPTDVEVPTGDPTRSMEKFGWGPKVSGGSSTTCP